MRVRRTPATDGPRVKVSDWRYVGLYRYDHEGRRQGIRARELHYTHPGLYKAEPEDHLTPRERILRNQMALAVELGIMGRKNADRREAAEFESNRAFVPEGTMLPHRKRAMTVALRGMGLDHLLD